MRTKVCTCLNCHSETVHKLVHRETPLSCVGPIRNVLAVLSVGVSEVINHAYVEKKYQCEKCGKITTG